MFTGDCSSALIEKYIYGFKNKILTSNNDSVFHTIFDIDTDTLLLGRMQFNHLDTVSINF